MDYYPPLKRRVLPPPPQWTKALGAGIVAMGLAIGTGELILWPHLVIKYGLSLLSFALIGIGCQFVLNREIIRHELATGEGFFTTSARIFRWSVFFWLPAALLIYIWPGWASAIGTTLSALFGFGAHIFWSWVTLALVLVLTFSGKAAYGMLERSLKVIVPTFFVILVVISAFNLSWADFIAAIKGTFSFGSWPQGIDINILLGAIVFSGAGGMLNLAFSLWYRDRQMGMGAYAGRITNPITGKNEAIAATGYTFDTSDENTMHTWRNWMRYVTVDQGVIFFFLGFITLFLLSANAYFVLRPMGLIPEGLQVAVVQANIFGNVLGPWGFKLFLVMAFLMLFSVMWAVIDALTRMVSDMIYTNAHAGPFQKVFVPFKRFSMGQLYYAIIVLVVLAGAVLVPLKQPLALLVISGVLSGLTMALYTPLIIFMNNVHLPKPLRPSWFTNIVMVGVAFFYIFFAYKVIAQYIA
jgi:Mn2+/Fe2+ NRAMP family transporter